MTYPSVKLQGNILTFDILEEIASGNAPKSTARDYGYESKIKLREAIDAAWTTSRSQYQIFKTKLARLDDEATAVTETRSSWIVPLLQEFGYDPIYNRRALEIDERSYPISHGDDSLGGFPIHIIGARQRGLDRRDGAMRMSAHALVQEYLNRDPNLYGIVTDGRFLRLLRDSSQLTKLSYVEFDLTRIFDEELSADFALLFRLLHRTRVPAQPEEGSDSIIEKYHLEGLASGSRIRDGLSKAVEKGILALGTGLLTDAENGHLRTWAETTTAAPDHYYQHLLKLIYRLLFVMVIEERDLIFPRTAQEEEDDVGAAAGAGEGLRSRAGEAPPRGGGGMTHAQIYYAYYSIQRLRKLSAKRQLANPREYDLWENLLNTFRLFEDDGSGAKLGIAPLAGDLFRPAALGPLRECRINNKVLLETLRGLSEYDNGQGGFITVNYANLDVEEFGSVYEGLLEYAPVIDENPWAFRFVEGTGRSSSGSHYTPDELVQPLIKHSLEHLIGDRTCAPDAPEAARKEAIRELLQLTVCDVACGSGHILLAAARRIGLEIARLETQEEQPNPTSLRRGTRAAIRHCIYGVDKNPLAVELCKVALWLEAHVPGEPLGFLDHRVRNGDAIVGLGRMEELQNGIATEAFKAYVDEEKDNVRNLKKRNKAERTKRENSGGTVQGGLFQELNPVTDRLERYQRRFAEFSRLPERTVAEIEAKEKAYRRAVNNEDAWFIQGLADLQVAQFFVPKTELDTVVTDKDYFDIMHGRVKGSRAEAVARGESVERKFFHWFLEFPEVFENGGFSCVLGNPPFLGSKKISGNYGKELANSIKYYYKVSGSADLVVYFFKRIFDILLNEGFQSLISTNTIAQGDSRINGLSSICNSGGEIVHAVKTTKWPGLAAVEVSLITIFKGNFKNPLTLNKVKVDRITTFLDDSEYLGEPKNLAQNADRNFQGTIVIGSGFVLSLDKGLGYLRNQENKDVVKYYLSNNDLTSNYDLKPSRMVIDFGSLPRSRYEDKVRLELKDELENRNVEIVAPNYKGKVATDYPELYSIVADKVYPQRLQNKRTQYQKYWWQFGERQTALYNSIRGFKSVLVVSMVSKYMPLSIVPASYVYTNKVGVFNLPFERYFGLFSSSIHQEWAWKYSSTLGSFTLNYSPTDCFETFPYQVDKRYGDEHGLVFNSYRAKIQLDTQLGLTKLYNQFHNPDLVPFYDDYWEDDELQLKPAELKKKSKETYYLWNHLQKTAGTLPLGEAIGRIVELRRLHKEMDEAVLAAYGWHVKTRRWGAAIKLRHDFYEVDYLPENDRVRYTIHPEARREVLKRLLLLNHEIHEAETRVNADGSVGVPYEVIDGEKIVAIMREQVEAWLPGGTAKLHPKTLKFLCSGEDLWPALGRGITGSYKPFVTSYASALENELLEKIFVPWNAAFQSRWKVDNDDRKTYLLEQMTLDNKLPKFCKMLLKEDTKYTLGDMQFILNIVYKTSGSTIKKSSLLQDFRAFVVSVYGEAGLDKAFLERVRLFVVEYRNEAAHTGSIDRALAEGCRSEVREMVCYLVENEKD